MKHLLIITFLGLIIIGCQSNSSNDDENSKIENIEEKLEPKSTVIEQETKEPELKLSEEEKLIIDLKSKYSHVRGKYVSFEIGDLFHHGFINATGREYDFVFIKDRTYGLSIADDNSESGESINPKYKGATFDIFYKQEDHDLLGWGEKMEVDVVYKMILVK